MVDPPELEYIEYVADSVTQIPKENQSSGNTPVQGDKRDEKPPIGITMKYERESTYLMERNIFNILFF